MQSVLISIATYNEIENLPRLIDAIFEHVPDSHVLVIDDGSPDGTGDWCDNRAATDTRFRCIHRPGKLGLGTATILGLQTACDEGYDFVINMDADFSHHPKYLPDLIAGMDRDGQVDVMIGTRYRPGGGVEGWPLSRKLMSRMVNAYARICLGLRVSDCSGSFRCYRTNMLRKIGFDQIESTGYSFFEEVLWHLRRAGATFGELPIVFVNRELGQSKISIKEAVKAVTLIGRLAARSWFS
ncbi:MAG: polyprenol monophosphomannose synthase [Planctomycetales bacterium]|nr:polyprenol monophosphomannose synthase [Planctomycetales bacterium]